MGTVAKIANKMKMWGNFLQKPRSKNQIANCKRQLSLNLIILGYWIFFVPDVGGNKKRTVSRPFYNSLVDFALADLRSDQVAQHKQAFTQVFVIELHQVAG